MGVGANCGGSDFVFFQVRSDCIVDAAVFNGL